MQPTPEQEFLKPMPCPHREFGMAALAAMLELSIFAKMKDKARIQGAMIGRAIVKSARPELFEVWIRRPNPKGW